MAKLGAALRSHSSEKLVSDLKTDSPDDDQVDMSGWDGDLFSLMSNPSSSSSSSSAQQGSVAARPELSDDDKTIQSGPEFTDAQKTALGVAVDLAKSRATTARGIINAAEEALDQVHGRMDELGDGQITQVKAIERWFGKTWRAQVDVIVRVYADIAAQAEIGLFKNYAGGGSDMVAEGSSMGTTTAYTAFGEGGAIFLFPKFWNDLDDIGKGYCALHEMSHWVHKSVLDKSSGASGRDGALAEAAMSSAVASMNAYSYQFFAEDM